MPRISKDWVDAYFQHGVDVSNRRVFLGEIDGDSVGAVVKGLYLMEGESRDKPCELFLSSCGGEVCETLALFDIVRTLRCPVHTFGYGQIMSASLLLLAAGEPGQRWVTENVVFMHHDWSDELSGRGAAIAADVAQAQKLDKKWLDLLAAHSKKPAAFWARKAKQPADFYFGADEAIEWGLADAIWSEKA